MSLTVGSRLGVSEIAGPIGAGGMGEVYRARDTTLDRDAALKILPASFAGDPDRLMRFEREAKTLASLNHPHIAQIYGIVESSGVRALAMELVYVQPFPGPVIASRCPARDGRRPGRVTARNSFNCAADQRPT